jgi:hypothetical protein
MIPGQWEFGKWHPVWGRENSGPLLQCKLEGWSLELCFQQKSSMYDLDGAKIRFYLPLYSVQGAGELLENGGSDGEAGGPAHGLPGPHRGRSRPAHHSYLPNAPPHLLLFWVEKYLLSVFQTRIKKLIFERWMFSMKGWRLLL